jgi:hypothetical protein
MTPEQRLRLPTEPITPSRIFGGILAIGGFGTAALVLLNR